jgi:NDP-sugar pyrophosphorylase family protein
VSGPAVAAGARSRKPPAHHPVGPPAFILPPIARPGTVDGSWGPLTMIGARTLLDHQLELLRGADVSDLYVFDAHHAAQLDQARADLPEDAPQIHFPIEARRQPLTRAAALLSAGRALRPGDDIVICLDANVATTQQLRPLIRCHLRNAALATLLLVPLAVPDAVQVDRLGRVSGPTDRPVPGRWRNGGLYVVAPEFFRRLPPDGEAETTTIPSLARLGRVYGLRSISGWVALTTPGDAAAAAAQLEPKRRPRRL